MLSKEHKKVWNFFIKQKKHIIAYIRYFCVCSFQFIIRRMINLTAALIAVQQAAEILFQCQEIDAFCRSTTDARTKHQ